MNNTPRQCGIIHYDSKKPLHIALVALILLLDIAVFVVVLWLLCQTPSRWWCYLPWLLFLALFPLLFWKRKSTDVTVDFETLEKIYNDDDLKSFKKYHMLESEFAKIDPKKYLKYACLRPFEEETVCSGEERDFDKKRRHCEIMAERLNPEREKRSKEIIGQFKTNNIETRTALLAEQIGVPHYDNHKKESK